MSKQYISVLFLVGYAPLICQTPELPKIELSVLDEASRRNFVPVFIAFKFQPHRVIQERVEGAFRLSMDIARGHYKRSLERFPSGEAQRHSDELANLTLTMRRIIARESEAAVRPFQDEFEAKLVALGASNIRRYFVVNMIAADIPSASLAAIENDDQVSHVGLIRGSRLDLYASVPAIGAATFWNGQGSITGAGQAVAVLDSGVYSQHPAFAGRVRSQRFLSANSVNCFFQGDYSDANDRIGHGTHVAGIIAGVGISGFQNVVGVAPGVSTIYNAKVFCQNNSSFINWLFPPEPNDADVLTALQWVITQTEAHVANLSFGKPDLTGDSLYNRTIDYFAVAGNLSIVVSAGNDGASTSVRAPATAYNVIAVAAMDTKGTATRADDTVASFSSRGPSPDGRLKPDIAAPGDDSAIRPSGIYSPDNTGAYSAVNGTSFAAPHIAGSAALLRAAGVQDIMAVKALLINSADPAPDYLWRSDVGWGYVNLANAYQQRSNLQSSSVQPLGYKLYRASVNGSIFATLVWNRITDLSGAWGLTNLDLLLYRENDGVLISQSNSASDTVEKVAASGTGSVILKVRSTASPFPTPEPYALATSQSAVSVAGPKISLGCSGPTQVGVAASFVVTCAVQNLGDERAFAVKASLSYPAAQGGIQDFGTVEPGGSVNRSWSVVAPATSGSPSLMASAQSESFGLSLSASTSFAFTVGTGCVFSLTSAGQTHAAAPTSGSVGVSTAAGCSWSVTGVPSWITITAGASGNGSGTVSYSVSANPSASRSVTLIIGGQPYTITQAGVGGSAGARFVPVAPCRIADSRNTVGTFGGPVMSGNTSRSFPIAQSACNVPANALAYSLNVTVVPRGSLGYLTMSPTGQSRPLVSTLNSPSGKIVANAAIVPAGLGGAVDVYVTDTADIILDINGYFAPPDVGGGLAFFPVTPCRISDTRNALGSFGGPVMSSGGVRSIPVASSSCNIPGTAQAYSINATVVPRAGLGYLTLWPTGQAQPLVSTLNSPDGSIVANAAIVPAGTGGAISAFVTDTTDLVLDINGYFAPPATGGFSFYAATPCRISDSRDPVGTFGGPVLDAMTTRSYPVGTSTCGIPASAQAYSMNATVVPNAGLGYLTLWPTGASQPLVSTLNSPRGLILANAAIVPAGAGGAISAFVTDRTHLILDINGYFAP